MSPLAADAIYFSLPISVLGGSGCPLMECDNMTTGRLAQWHTPVIIVTVSGNILSSSGQILMTLRIVVVNVVHRTAIQYIIYQY